MDSMIGRMDSPSSDNAYTTFGGTSGKTVRVMIPSVSIERKLSVNTFWLIPSRFFCSSLKRQGRWSKLRMISNFHLLPINCTVVATGQAGSSSFFTIKITSYTKWDVTFDFECYTQIILWFCFDFNRSRRQREPLA